MTKIVVLVAALKGTKDVANASDWAGTQACLGMSAQSLLWASSVAQLQLRAARLWFAHSFLAAVHASGQHTLQ
jgi:hypothetical protein